MIKVDDRIEQSYVILDKLRLSNNMYKASFSSTYNFIWLRDTFYEVMPYLDKSCGRYLKTCHAILDILKRYKSKLKIHTYQKPIYTYEYLHPRYTIEGYEVDVEWGNAQNDSTAAILWMFGEAISRDMNLIRNDEDLEIIQMLVDYLYCIEYWHDHDNSLWEEDLEIHASSIGACVSSLIKVKDIVNVPDELIQKGIDALSQLLTNESISKTVDAAQLSLIYPFQIVDRNMAETIIKNVESELVRDKGCLRYKFDSYYSTLEKDHGRNHHKEFYDQTEMQWTMFIPWLAICHLELGNIEKAKEYIDMTEELFDENGYLPEGYMADGKPCPNNPLGWSHALHILSVEKYENRVNR
jgi:phosphorylase kinase alpha/beta subunit